MIDMLADLLTAGTNPRNDVILNWEELPVNKQNSKRMMENDKYTSPVTLLFPYATI